MRFNIVFFFARENLIASYCDASSLSSYKSMKSRRLLNEGWNLTNFLRDVE
jgi:hypothetical protein